MMSLIYLRILIRVTISIPAIAASAVNAGIAGVGV